MHCPEYPTGAKQSLLTSNRHPNGQGLEKSGVQVPDDIYRDTQMQTQLVRIHTNMPTQGYDAPHLKTQKWKVI